MPNQSNNKYQGKKKYLTRGFNDDQSLCLAFDIPASLDELLEIPFFMIDHSQSVVNGEDGHARSVAFIQHVGQKLGRQQEILRPESDASAI